MALPRTLPHTGQLVEQTQAKRRPCTPSVLIVDNDTDSLKMLRPALTVAGTDLTIAGSGWEGLASARRGSFALMLVEQRLPDLLGISLVRMMRDDGVTSPFVLVGRELTTPVTVEAMRLGALDVMDKPVKVDHVVKLVFQALSVADSKGTGAVPHPGPAGGDSTIDAQDAGDHPCPGSAAERWAWHVLKACESTKDLKTIEEWAAYIGVSYSSLRESCRVVGVRAHDARDLMRVLRAVLKANRHHCSPQVLLNVSDVRTLDKLLRRAGLRGHTGDPVTARMFLRDQQFMSRDNAGLRVLILLCYQHHRGAFG